MPALHRDFALEVHFSRWEFAARYHLTASDIESITLRDLLAYGTPEDREAFETLSLGYTQTYGAPALRAAIAATYERMAPENILCFAGAEEGIYIAMRVLLAPGDHCLVVTPNYQAAETLPLSMGVAVSGVALDEAQGWRLDAEAVRAALRPNTKLISINFPNNPTGAIMPRADFDALITLCQERGIWLFSDEVYRMIERDPALRLPNVADVYERGLSLNVLSKAYGLPGLRIGWLAAQDTDVLRACERYKHYLSICNSGPSEALALIALNAREPILARNRALVSENREKLGRFFARYPDLFDWYDPDGGCIGFPRYRGADGVEAFTANLLEDAGILLLPASLYRSDLGPVPTDRFRIGFGRANIDEALAAFEAWLQRNRA